MQLRIILFVTLLGTLFSVVSCGDTPTSNADKTVLKDSLLIQKDTTCMAKDMEQIPQALRQAPQAVDNKIEFFSSDGKDLAAFFCKLKHIDSLQHDVRVMHFGDSQILRDRGTKKLRSLLGKHYKGNGPGLYPVGRILGGYKHRSIKCTHSDNWVFYDAFLFPDKKVPHRKYGLTSIFSRYAEVLDTLSSHRTAWVEYTPSRFANDDVKQWKDLKMFFANPHSGFKLRIFSDSVLLLEKSFEQNADAQVFDYKFDTPQSHTRFEFVSECSPDFYGVSFGNEPGLKVDNIGLCGSAGTFFTKIDEEAQQLMLSELNPALIILQFGGNTVPPTKSKAQVKRYSMLFESQIQRIQSMTEDVPIIVIGPSDMPYQKDSVTWLTYSYLDDIVDAMRLACENTGAYYWDMYRIMGGKGSMLKWYELNLVNGDRIHFNTSGINRIMELFYEALIKLDENQ